MTNHNLDLTKSHDVKIHMLGSLDEKNWDDRCDDVKKANDGRYPSFWWEDINKSGLMAMVHDQWKKR